MRTLELSERLQAVAEMIPDGCGTLADIGSDHAYLPCYCVMNGFVEKAVAADINQGPVDNAKLTVRKYGLDDSVEVRKGAGLSVLLPGEVDVVSINGMGGSLISSILEEGLADKAPGAYLVLQPNNSSDRLRSWLENNSYGIIDEAFIEEDGHYYEVISAGAMSGRTKPLSEAERMFGPILLQKRPEGLYDKWLREYMKWKRNVERIEEAVPSKDTEERKKQFHKKMKIFEEAFNWVNGSAGQS